MLPETAGPGPAGAGSTALTDARTQERASAERQRHLPSPGTETCGLQNPPGEHRPRCRRKCFSFLLEKELPSDAAVPGHAGLRSRSSGTAEVAELWLPSALRGRDSGSRAGAGSVSRVGVQPLLSVPAQGQCSAPGTASPGKAVSELFGLPGGMWDAGWDVGCRVGCRVQGGMWDAGEGRMQDVGWNV